MVRSCLAISSPKPFCDLVMSSLAFWSRSKVISSGLSSPLARSFSGSSRGITPLSSEARMNSLRRRVGVPSSMECSPLKPELASESTMISCLSNQRFWPLPSGDWVRPPAQYSQARSVSLVALTLSRQTRRMDESIVSMAFLFLSEIERMWSRACCQTSRLSAQRAPMGRPADLSAICLTSSIALAISEAERPATSILK